MCRPKRDKNELIRIRLEAKAKAEGRTLPKTTDKSVKSTLMYFHHVQGAA